MKKLKAGAIAVAKFLKKNIYYVLIICCVAAIGAMVTVTIINNRADDATPADGLSAVENPPVDNPIDEPVNKPDDGKKEEDPKPDEPEPSTPEPVAIVFANPVADATVIKDYSMDALVWNSTLKQYQTHDGVDFAKEEGSPVLAAYDGAVASVTNDTLNGTVITINHDNGLQTVYGSLGNATVAAGDKVTKGAEIGTVSTSYLAEASDGAHLHFEVLESGENISPWEYLVTPEK